MQLIIDPEPVEFVTQLLLPFTLDEVYEASDPWATAQKICGFANNQKTSFWRFPHENGFSEAYHLMDEVIASPDLVRLFVREMELSAAFPAGAEEHDLGDGTWVPLRVGELVRAFLLSKIGPEDLRRGEKFMKEEKNLEAPYPDDSEVREAVRLANLGGRGALLSEERRRHREEARRAAEGGVVVRGAPAEEERVPEVGNGEVDVVVGNGAAADEHSVVDEKADPPQAQESKTDGPLPTSTADEIDRIREKVFRRFDHTNRNLWEGEEYLSIRYQFMLDDYFKEQDQQQFVRGVSVCIKRPPPHLARGPTLGLPETTTLTAGHAVFTPAAHDKHVARQSVRMTRDTWLQMASLSKTIAAAFALELFRVLDIDPFSTTVNDLLRFVYETKVTDDQHMRLNKLFAPGCEGLASTTCSPAKSKEKKKPRHTLFLLRDSDTTLFDRKEEAKLNRPKTKQDRDRDKSELENVDPKLWAEEITLEKLVNHSALGMHYVYGFEMDQKRICSYALLMQGQKFGYESLDVIKKPGTKFKYSGGGFLVLQYLLELMFELPLDIIFERFLGHCGMEGMFSFGAPDQAIFGASLKTPNRSAPTKPLPAEPGTHDTDDLRQLPCDEETRQIRARYARGYRDNGELAAPYGRLLFPALAAGGEGTPTGMANFLVALCRAYDDIEMTSLPLTGRRASDGTVVDVEQVARQNLEKLAGREDDDAVSVGGGAGRVVVDEERKMKPEQVAEKRAERGRRQLLEARLKALMGVVPELRISYDTAVRMLYVDGRRDLGAREFMLAVGDFSWRSDDLFRWSWGGPGGGTVSSLRITNDLRLCRVFGIV